MSIEKDPRIKMLVVDDVAQNLELVQDALAEERVQLFMAPSAEAALERFVQVRPRIVLSDFVLPGMNGLELLDRVLANDPAIDFILMTGYYSTESAVDAIRRGACDYLPKPIDVQKLRTRVRALVAEADTRRETSRLDQDMIEAYQFEGMIGRSPLMLEVFTKIRRIAPHFRSVLLTGPTGTGKELVARALHRLSPVSGAPFAICNCSALVESLVESELFGYVRGAFTGATQDRHGIFEYANGGTVFLDEVGELSLSAQAKLLRVLQSHEVQRIGSPIPHKVDVRVIAATHRDLRKMVAQGQFREDLFYRLSVVEISTPPLAQRKEDLPLLQRHFLEKYSTLYEKRLTGITRRAQTRLATHSWPGNVRELENVISGGCIMAIGNVIDLQDLPASLRAPAASIGNDGEEFLTLEAMQQRYLMRVLDQVGGNKAKAAEILGVGRNTVYQMLNRMRAGSRVLGPRSKAEPEFLQDSSHPEGHAKRHVS
ncbi:MAG: sigma-54 dependent transcriptional regulator [Acidobacteriia bacterium]|nr:sigma-54 dependent transcriptional regulator [Terriglobia bacterium]